MTEEQERAVRIETIANGGAAERFDYELGRVLANIDDPNTDPERARSITVTVTFRPRKDRSAAAIVVASAAKLAPVKPVDAEVYLGKRNGKRLAVEFDPRQGDFFDDNRPKLVTPLRGDTAAKGGSEG